MASIDSTSPAKAVGEIFCCRTVEVVEPILEVAVISIDVLNMIGTPDSGSGREINGLMSDNYLLLPNQRSHAHKHIGTEIDSGSCLGDAGDAK